MQWKALFLFLCISYASSSLPFSVPAALSYHKHNQKEYQFDQIYTTERNILGNNVQELRCAVITGNEHFTAGPVKVNVLDRIGTGDSFVAGVLYGINNQYNPQDTINFALSSFALKHTIVGDFQIASKADVQQFDVDNEKVVIKR